MKMDETGRDTSRIASSSTSLWLHAWTTTLVPLLVEGLVCRMFRHDCGRIQMQHFQGLIPFKLHWSHPKCPFLGRSPPTISDPYICFSGILRNLRMAWSYELTIERDGCELFHVEGEAVSPPRQRLCVLPDLAPQRWHFTREVWFTPCVMTFCSG
jgi:hypothetical protein